MSALCLLDIHAGPIYSQSIFDKADARTELPSKFAQIAGVTRGPVGAAVLVVEKGTVVSLHGEQRFPMQSVYKLPIGMAILHMVDLGRLKLDQPVRILPRDFVPASRGSPIRDDHPHGITMTVAQLMDAMMSVSDGTASDVLLQLAGGPAHVTAYLRGIGVRDVVVATTERAMAHGEPVQYRNWATPNAMVDLLRTLHRGAGLSPPSQRLLLNLMTASQTGPNRIKGLLPTGTVVAHKTGSSGTVGGVTRATNDVGLITLPDGNHLAIAVFVSDTKVSNAVQEKVIARIARAAWDCRDSLYR